MYLFLIRLRAKKLAKHGKEQTLRTRVLLDARGAEMDPQDRTIIEDRLLYAADLEQGLDRPRLGQIGQAKIFRNCADETMRKLEGMLPPETVRIRRLRRRINS